LIVQSAFQKDAVLLADIAAARARSRLRLWWLGQSGFLLYADGKTILFDPYLSDSLTQKYAGTDKPHTRMTERVVAPNQLTGVDVVASSHNHSDHLDAETLVPLLAANPKARLLIGRANRSFVLERLGKIDQRLVELDAGEQTEIDGIQFYGIASAHNTVERDEHGRCRFLGFIARLGGLTIYHSGDTKLHDGLSSSLKSFKPDIALLPINGDRPERRVAGNLNGVEAARLARDIGANLVVPHHFDTFEFNTASPEEFEAECRKLGQPYKTLRHGEGVDL